ncbi:hypothetical protein FRC91_13475 [Bradymonadales bacterium TMQ1]|uniref:Roadblock/LAMTOR2 domain-containing protein n=1 Tax=Lujinxingia sediminis TaxID=2480984 RepID=A0ABY0CU32_9DELT|nr:hypothetical protein [Lujinxingia sediminis]RVU45777.1 hypothetical protein EA187_08415 [Lujinxingia sediminis]TXC75089.1 hypothetical protein FRC91_13475 [Bradymonadales bacterium TMQ1]
MNLEELNRPDISTAEQPERRRRRAERPELALGYQLDQVVRDFALRCCVLVDEQGAMVAASPDCPSAFMQALVGLAPTMAVVPEHRETHLQTLRRHNPLLECDEVAVCAFRAGGRRLFIAAVGQEAVMNDVAIFRAITGARRIL